MNSTLEYEAVASPIVQVSQSDRARRPLLDAQVDWYEVAPGSDKPVGELLSRLPWLRGTYADGFCGGHVSPFRDSSRFAKTLEGGMGMHPTLSSFRSDPKDYPA